ncbi:MAG: LysR family transcriptional regulator [Neisseriaceae bacterium]|nr:LysR family transcriptional regulator [Neisseriaceae bacterium]
MTLNELRYAVIVAKERHFGRAALLCNVSQPTLSIAIRKLEEKLGVILFDRSAAEVLITPEGLQIIEQARRVLDEVSKLEKMANKKQDELEGIFRLGLIFTVAPYLLPKLVLNLNTIAPKMPLMLEENYTHVLVEALKHGKVDAIIAAEPFNESGLDYIPLYQEPFFLITPKGHHLESHSEVTPKQIAKERVLLLTEGNCMRDNILSSCKELAAQQRILGLTNTLQGTSINTLRHMVATGLGISLLPASALNEHEHLPYSIIPFKAPAPSRCIILAYRKNYIRQQALEAIRKAAISVQIEGLNFAQP